MRFIQYEMDPISATADAYSEPVDISSVFACGLHAHVITGDAKGKAYIQLSCDPINTATPANFVTYGNHADLTGSAVEAYAYNELCANWLRIFWDHSSGTGTVRLHIKTNGY